MGKKRKKVKWKNRPSTFKTCVIGMAILIVAGIGVLIYGSVFGMSSDDVKTADAEIVSLELVDRDLSDSQIEQLEEKGTDENSIYYEYEVGYRFTVDGKEYSHTGKKLYDQGKELKIGDKESIRYAVVDGDVRVNPETGTYYGVIGIILIGIGLLAGVAAFVLRR